MSNNTVEAKSPATQNYTVKAGQAVKLEISIDYGNPAGCDGIELRQGVQTKSLYPPPGSYPGTVQLDAPSGGTLSGLEANCSMTIGQQHGSAGATFNVVDTAGTPLGPSVHVIAGPGHESDAEAYIIFNAVFV